MLEMEMAYSTHSDTRPFAHNGGSDSDVTFDPTNNPKYDTDD